MKWFQGSINEAVATSKSKKAVFVVFVEGKDDTSQTFGQIINTSEVSSLLEQDNFVSIRLESGSDAYRSFALIYQLVPVPSLFFIGENGRPLEIIARQTTASDLVTKIRSVLFKAGKDDNQSSVNFMNSEKETSNVTKNLNNDIVIASCSSQNPNQETEIEASSSANNLEIESSVNMMAGSSHTETKETKSVDSNINNQNESKLLTIEEKVERAKQLMELQKQQRIEEEKKKDREQELERRKLGRDMQNMRRQQKDLEYKQAHEERMKEKAADAAAREKVRQQIAQDKLERKQKELAQQQLSKSQEIPKINPTAANNATIARIQFKLPFGNPHTAQFEPSNTLQSLRTYVLENIEIPFRQFAMSTSFPRREFTSEDDNKTLLELELVPTAVILILPLKTTNNTKAITPAQNAGFLSRVIWTLFAPIVGVYNYLYQYFYGQQNRTSGADSSTSTGGTVPLTRPQNIGLLRRNITRRQTVRTQGNIHRLHSSDDENDENNTWNGNSTQQM